MEKNYKYPIAKEKLAQNFKILRINNNKSLKQVAIEIGISYSYIHDIENMKKSASLDTIDKIAKYFKVDVYELFL